MKPRITPWMNGFWLCFSPDVCDGGMLIGRTPEEAYQSWHAHRELEAQKRMAKLIEMAEPFPHRFEDNHQNQPFTTH